MAARVPIALDWTYLHPHLTPEQIEPWAPKARLCHEMLHEGICPGSDFRGWLDPRAIISPEELAKVKDLAKRLRDTADMMVSVAIGGSYLGARAVLEALQRPGEAPNVLFAGKDLSAHSHAALLRALEDKEFCVNVISKSGTTVEPAIAFRLLRDLLVRSLGEERARGRIVATTDASKGILRRLATQEGYQTLAVPGAVGGRYSVLSAVGLLPICFARIDVEALLAGAADCADACLDADLAANPAYFYAAARNALFSRGFRVEILANFEPRLHYFAEWWKQLFAESEGKDGTGIFPTAVDFTTDLHSLGQWIQQGQRLAFETFLHLDLEPEVQTIPYVPEDTDELNYLAGKSLHEVNMQAYRGTALAHHEGGVPNMTVSLPALDAYNLGALIYFFEKACAVSGCLLGINPFNQPGVEHYKRNMFALLRKPGAESEAERVLGTLAAQERAIVRFA